MDTMAGAPQIRRPMTGPPATPLRTPRRHRILEKRHVHPSSWNAEVVSALCTRLPGGRTSVTTKCEQCGSLFYPCLCSSKIWRRHEDYMLDLKAPRVVKISEEIRMQKGAHRVAAGNLSLVLKNQDVSGLDKDRLCVLGNQKLVELHEHNDKSDKKRTAGKPRYGQVVRREGDTYVVIPDGAEKYTQQLTLTAVELDSLMNTLKANSLEIDGQHQAADQGVSSEKIVVRKVNVRYETLPKGHDITLVVKKRGVFVYEVEEGGIAAAQQVCQGHRVVGVCTDDGGCFEEVELEDLPSDFMLEPPATSELGEAMGIWPLIITFDVLPAGWRIVTCGEQKVESVEELRKKVDEAKAKANGGDYELVVSFEKDAEVEVPRYHHLVRHEHVWEQELREKHPEQVSSDANVQLLKFWGIGAKMTPHQVCFAFQSLINGISDKLRAFDDQKDDFRRMLKEKCRRYVETRKRHERERAVGRYPNNAELDNNEKEVHAVCDEVPLWFLRDMQQEAEQKMEPKEVDNGASKKRRSDDEAKQIHEWEVWKEMNTHIEKYIEELNNKNHKQKDVKKKGKKNAGSDQGSNKVDGRLNPVEFEKCLHHAGISWLGRRDIREKFEAMDADKSGKLNLGEVLSAATRIMELVQQATLWSETQDKKIPHDELLSRYSQYLTSQEIEADDGDRKPHGGLSKHDTENLAGMTG
eukprot:gnl/MRDRNA2_/MRDRNA2_91844_c0_seq1.p1 gnl/MRDRNA2_/MRDRNA2_91844_c0~~gnl/MRDRNA2_/MRDRNA2_91844_c0_seq1.p1  ORF type:complete len:694 (+),score=162.05 gnl/MRDRNA2_/MRDRNA2_91844_c0_seq1:78-2159(+)